MDLESRLRKRIEGNPIEPLLARLVDHMVGAGYSAVAARAYVGAADHFGRWLGGRALSAASARRYLRQHLPACRCRGLAPRDARWNAGAVNHLMALAAKMPGGGPSAAQSFADELMSQYAAYLDGERGVKPSTVRSSVRQARRTLSALGGRRAADLRGWTAERVRRHVARETVGRAGSTNQATTAYVRVFLGFLYRRELLRHDLVGAVPTVPFWNRPEAAPRLAGDTLGRLMRAAFADRTSQGLRNRALLLCLAELGVRASDLVGLELGGIDWAASTLRLTHVKGRREAVLPMSRRLAATMRAYVLRGRPACPTTWVFVHHRAPAGRPLGSPGVRDVLVKLSRAAGLDRPMQSTHAFRRAFADRMLGAGASIKQVADVLGHRSINTTVRYARADVASLRRIALPWPGASDATPKRTEVRP